MNPLFSIIIPIYNGLSHGLSKCLDSIWNQPLDSSIYEVVCVDDCSTDQTRTWLHEQKKKHSNLRVICNEENLRQGGSRNKGIRAAQGKYIVFIDQDDYYHHDAIARIYDHLKDSDLQILIVDCAYQYFGKESNKIQHNFPNQEVMTGDQIIACNSIPYAPWKFIIEREFIIENNLFFIEHERIEDVDWVHKVVHYANRVQYQPILFIHYNKYPESTTMSSFFSKDVVYSGLRMANRLRSLVSYFEDSACQDYMKWLTNQNYYVYLRSCFFVADNIGVKVNHIKVCTHPFLDRTDCPLILKFAAHYPTLFAYTTNFCSPLARMSMHIYRKLKNTVWN